MKNIRNHALICLTATFLVIMFAPQARAALESGVPFQTWVNSMSFTNIDILVPEGATRLTVSISNGSGDLDLYLKYGSPVSGSTIAEIDADADIRSDGPTADESISITPSTTPALRAGTWYVATLNLNDETTSFTIIAAIEKAANSVDLGSVVVGQTTQKSIDISNPGTADLIVTSVGVTGTDSTMFSTTHNCTTVRPAETCIINVTFSPTAPGVKIAQLNIYSNDPDTPSLVIHLTGAGLGDIDVDTLLLPSGKENYPVYPPAISAVTGINPAICKPIGVGDVAADGETVSVEIKLENPSGAYDAYLALQAPALDPNEFFMLGQDGTFYPFSQSGLVKWKQSATGKIEEKPFGDFPVSLLPGGTYNFNFMLTPAGSRDAYYLWQTSFSAPETTIEVPDGSAGFFNGTLVVPNATIIYQGNTYEGSAPLAEDGIVGIQKDGKPYLYHPAMGLAELSEYNSRRAVGYFMAGVSASEIATLRAQRAQTTYTTENLESLRSASSTVAKVVGVGQTVQLGTGINIELLNSEGLTRAINKTRRFAVVKTGASYSDRYFLIPRATTIPTEILDPFFGAYNLYATGSFYNSERSDIKAKEKIETFGAFFRLYPAFRESGWDENQLEAMEKDKELTNVINTIDLNYCILDFARNFTGVFPLECVDALTSGLFRILQAEMVFCITGDKDAGWQLEKDAIRSVVSNLMGCFLTSSTVGFSETVFLFFDMLSLANWIVDDLLVENVNADFGLHTDAYDLASVGSGMVAYREVSRENPNGKPVMHNQLNGKSWDIKIPGKEITTQVPEIVGITDAGVVVLHYNSADKDYKTLLGVPDWGRGVPIDLIKVSHPQVEVCAHDTGGVDVSGDGRVVFNGEWYNEENWDWDHAICCIFMNDGFRSRRILKDDYQYNTFRFHEPLSISYDGLKLVFAHGCSLHSIHPSGADGKLLTSLGAPTCPKIRYVNISDSGNLALFSYCTEFGDETTTVLHSISTSGTSPVNLTEKTGLTTIWESAVASPNGEWIAAIGIDPSRPSDSDLRFRILLISADGVYHRWVDTKNICPSYIYYNPKICFTRDNKSIIFAGHDSLAILKYSDIFAVNIDENHPNLRYVTKTPEISEKEPVLR